MIRTFKDKKTENMWEGDCSKDCFEKIYWDKFTSILMDLDTSANIKEFSKTPGMKVEKIIGLPNGWKARINNKYRLTWIQKGNDSYEVCISNHYK